MNNPFQFTLIHTSKKSRARVGQLITPHGTIETPNFVPVATNATLKSIDSTLARQLDIQLLFCNTYHLLLHPGPAIIKQAGGLHSFMQRSGPIITDSGGFQVFSLAFGSVVEELKNKGQKKGSSSVIKVTEEGVLFRSYRDGTPILLTPESSIQAQKALGADIIIPLDELPPYHITPQQLRASLDRTHRWEKRSLEEHLRSPQQQAMYAVIHGGIDPALRIQSCSFLSSLPFDGFAIGGSLGKQRQEMITMLTHLMPHLPWHAPNHLLGIGDPTSLRECIPLGIDTFDSSHPTKCARHGYLFTKQGGIKIIQSKYKAMMEPIDETCDCLTCKQYSLAYLHHLFKAREMTGMLLATMHNLFFMTRLMRFYRECILNDEL
jgi:queuine tRNA-ribosyltransferase